MTDPRAALAEVLITDTPLRHVGGIGEPEEWAAVIVLRLAERGVRLVTEERLRAALLTMPPLDADRLAAAIFAALAEPK